MIASWGRGGMVLGKKKNGVGLRQMGVSSFEIHEQVWELGEGT